MKGSLRGAEHWPAIEQKISLRLAFIDTIAPFFVDFLPSRGTGDGGDDVGKDMPRPLGVTARLSASDATTEMERIGMYSLESIQSTFLVLVLVLALAHALLAAEAWKYLGAGE